MKECRQQLIDAVSKCTNEATTIDAWTSRRRSYLCETIHWFDYLSLKINSACLRIRRIKEIHTYDVLTIIIEDLHNEYEVIEKFRGSTTNNGSDFREISGNRNWMKKMIWFILKSEKLLTLDLTITLTICILLFHFIVDALAIFKV